MFFVSVWVVCKGLERGREGRRVGERRTFLKGRILADRWGERGGRGRAYVIVYRSEDFLGRYEEACHLPYCHLEVHLRELE